MGGMSNSSDSRQRSFFRSGRVGQNSRRWVRTALAVLVAFGALFGTAPAAGAVTRDAAGLDVAFFGGAAWGASATCWVGQFDLSIVMQGEYDGQWLAYRTYLAVWDARQGRWIGGSGGWVQRQDPAGAAAMTEEVSYRVAAGNYLNLWVDFAYYTGDGWDHKGWQPAQHTTNEWTPAGNVRTVTGSYCAVS